MKKQAFRGYRSLSDQEGRRVEQAINQLNSTGDVAPKQHDEPPAEAESPDARPRPRPLTDDERPGATRRRPI